MARGKPLSFNREEALARAMELFWERGFEMTSMTDLLQRMGIQRQSFYNTFGNKEKVFLEAVALYARTMMTKIKAILGQPGNPLDNVRQVLAMWRELAADKDGYGCLLGNSIAEFGLNNETISGLLKGQLELLEQAFYQTFQRAVQEGYLSSDKDPGMLARSFIVMSQGVALLSKLGYGPEMMGDVMKTADILLEP